MHHLGKLEPLAGVRLRSDVNDEIASENRAIARIEEGIDNYTPPTCEWCPAPAMDFCSLCDLAFCERDGATDGFCRDCEAEVMS